MRDSYCQPLDNKSKQVFRCQGVRFHNKITKKYQEYYLSALYKHKPCKKAYYIVSDYFTLLMTNLLGIDPAYIRIYFLFDKKHI